MNQNFTNSILINCIWRLLERIGSQSITLIVSIILARLLDPNVYGIVALVVIINTILNVFVDSGFAKALVQKKEFDEKDFSTVFVFNTSFCIALYFLIYIIAPYVSEVYNVSNLSVVIRVMGISIILYGIRNVLVAYISKFLLFKKMLFSSLMGTVCGAFVGIFMALNGFGLWALVFKELVSAIVDTLILWFLIEWKPTFYFSKERLKSLFAYGWKILIASLLIHGYNNIRQLVVGKVYMPSDLAYFNQGRQFPNAIATNINNAMDSVLFTIYSNEQDNKEKIKNIIRKSLNINTFIQYPVLLGLFFSAENFIQFVLSEKWLPCVPYFRIYCGIFILEPIITNCINSIKAIGKSEVALKVTVIDKFFGLIFLYIVLYYGPIMIASSMLFTSVISVMLCFICNRYFFNYTLFEQCIDIFPNFALSLVTGGLIYICNNIHSNYALCFIIQFLLGFCVYISLSYLFKTKGYKYFNSKAHQMLYKFKHKIN